jgi:hypothetical protein
MSHVSLADRGLTAPSRRLRYSVGMTITGDMQAAIGKVPAGAWTPAYDGDGQVRDGAWVADITACGPRMEQGPLGFFPELRTPPLPATHVRAGTGQEHGPGATQQPSSDGPPSW